MTKFLIFRLDNPFRGCLKICKKYFRPAKSLRLGRSKTWRLNFKQPPLDKQIDEMKIKFYGTRGSIPVCDAGFQEFGGNTTCLQLTFESGKIAILDAGSGIRNLGKDLLKNQHQQFEDMLIAFTHFHWDHIQGFPFFAPAFDPQRHFTITALGKNREIQNLQEIFENQMEWVYFPVSLDRMGAKFTFHHPQTDTYYIDDAKIIAQLHDHPGQAYSYRIEENGKTIVFATDVEHKNGIDARLVQIAQNADILIHDAQYTQAELTQRTGWGHSSWQQAVQVAKQAHVKKLILTHHDPEHNDQFLAQLEKEAQKQFPNCHFARERQEFEV